MSINRLIGGLSLLTLSSTMVQGQNNIVAVDRLGNAYTQEDIAMPTGGQQMMMGGGGYCNPCTAGYFNLSFGPGSGMDQNTPTDIARQQVAIRVFEDFSELIIPAIDPCTSLPNPGPFVVYDAMGAEVMRAEVPAYTPRWEFSTAALAPAMYHYRVRGPSGKVSDGKLSIIR